jgi:hypothetical protein
MLTPKEAWATWKTVWKAKSPQDKWEDGMRTLFGINWRLIPDELHDDGEGGELRLASDTRLASDSPTPICTIMIRPRPKDKQEIRQPAKE